MNTLKKVSDMNSSELDQSNKEYLEDIEEYKVILQKEEKSIETINNSKDLGLIEKCNKLRIRHKRMSDFYSDLGICYDHVSIIKAAKRYLTRQCTISFNNSRKVLFATC